MAPPCETPADARTRHKKELKVLDGEKRSILKKTKATAGKGKKGKEALAAVEQEYAAKEKEMAERHKSEIGRAEVGGGEASGKEGGSVVDKDGAPLNPSAATAPKEDPEEAKRREKQDKAREKARRKKEKSKQKEKQREEQIAEDLANAGPSRKDLEIAAMRELYLDPAGLDIRDVEADGNCLYRAVGHQCGGRSYVSVRVACADSLAEHEDEFAPFVDIHDIGGSFKEYVESVRNTSEWGGHLELRALTHTLRRPIVVYSADAAPLRIGDEFDEEGEEIRLSFHRHYYALGEHYNSVVPK